MAATTTPLRVRDLCIRHEDRGGFTPDTVTFDVEPGEVVLVLGPSGSGKSTLTLALNGLVPQAVPASITGSVHVAGADARTTPVARLSDRVAMVFQDPDAQIVTGSVLDEVCFAPENQLVAASEVLERAGRALRRVGLWERRQDDPGTLSGGERQRLAIACALAANAELLVLDEPTANLDGAGAEEVYAALRDIRRTRAIVLVEHNLDVAIELVDRVVVLDRAGRQVADGPVRDVLAGRARRLASLGVWLPVATLAALRLADAGIDLDPLPLTAAELAAALDARESLPELPERPADSTGPRGETAVSVRSLTVRRDGRTILHDVDLDIERGSFVAVVGVNGAGKTTLLQAIAGVSPPPVGSVRIGDLDPAVDDRRRLAASVGYVFQNPEHQFIRPSVAEELAHGLRIRRVDPDETDRRVDDMLARFGLTELRDEHPFLLSGGQKRRLSVGTALITGAGILVLDEPTFGQDRAGAAELLGLLGTLNAAGTTVIVATHDMQLVADHADHVAIMHAGRLAGFGPTRRMLGSGLLEDAGLRPPRLASGMRTLRRHPSWRSVTSVRDLPGGAPA